MKPWTCFECGEANGPEYTWCQECGEDQPPTLVRGINPVSGDVVITENEEKIVDHYLQKDVFERVKEDSKTLKVKDISKMKQFSTPYYNSPSSQNKKPQKTSEKKTEFRTKNIPDGWTDGRTRFNLVVKFLNSVDGDPVTARDVASSFKSRPSTSDINTTNVIMNHLLYLGFLTADRSQRNIQYSVVSKIPLAT
jgi:hypothetical protein